MAEINEASVRYRQEAPVAAEQENIEHLIRKFSPSRGNDEIVREANSPSLNRSAYYPYAVRGVVRQGALNSGERSADFRACLTRALRAAHHLKLFEKLTVLKITPPDLLPFPVHTHHLNEILLKLILCIADFLPGGAGILTLEAVDKMPPSIEGRRSHYFRVSGLCLQREGKFGNTLKRTDQSGATVIPEAIESYLIQVRALVAQYDGILRLHLTPSSFSVHVHFEE